MSEELELVTRESRFNLELWDMNCPSPIATLE